MIGREEGKQRKRRTGKIREQQRKERRKEGREKEGMKEGTKERRKGEGRNEGRKEGRKEGRLCKGFVKVIWWDCVFERLELLVTNAAMVALGGQGKGMIRGKEGRR